MTTNESGEWFFDFTAFEKAINSNTKIVLLTNPHNPCGKMFSAAEVKQMSEILDKHPHVMVITDDVYFHLPFDGRKHVSFASYSKSNWEKTITIFSAGKMLNCTGWKIGWAIGPSRLIKQAMFVHEAMSFNTNVPGQIAIARSLH
jgi:aspartate/methionine/tyrosine aminotransferase